MKNGISKDKRMVFQDISARCAHYCWNVSTSKHVQWTELENVFIDLFTY